MKAKTLKDVLSNIKERTPATPVEGPRLEAVKGRAKPSLKLIDTSRLREPNYGLRNDAEWVIDNADALEGLKCLPTNFVDCVVTSPPYYWQRDYNVEGQTGHEDTVQDYVEKLAKVFHEVRRVLKSCGTLFLNLGDTYYSGNGQPRGGDPKQVWRSFARRKYRAVDKPGFGLPQKSLIGVPWRVALALQADSWILRSAIVWRKPKGLAEPSVRDRPWTTTESVFILTKSGNYYFDRAGLEGQEDVWDIPAPNGDRRFRHAAPFPEALVSRCLAVGCPPKGVVLDPYAGSGTTLVVASDRGSPSIGIELSPHYVNLARQRLNDIKPR